MKPAFSTAEMCTKTSFPPLSGWMNPYPLVGLNHFTVPIATSDLPVAARRQLMAARAYTDRKNPPGCAGGFSQCPRGMSYEVPRSDDAIGDGLTNNGPTAA